MANAYERHDISDESWAKIEFLLPGRKGTWGGNARDNRQFINAVFWILRTGAPWRDLPPSYGDWKNTHRRFCRWRDKGVWEKLLQELIDNPAHQRSPGAYFRLRSYPVQAAGFRSHFRSSRPARKKARACSQVWEKTPERQRTFHSTPKSGADC